MKQKYCLAIIFAMMFACGAADAQKLTLVKKYPNVGSEWASRFGLTGENKPAGAEYRLREEVRVPNLIRSKSTSEMQLIISEKTNFGSFALFRSPMSEDYYGFTLAIYNKEDKLAREFDLCRVTDEWGLEVQDIRYDKGRFYFNMACPTYSDQYHGKCSRLYCFDAKTGVIVWKTDYLTSNDIIVMGDGFLVCSYGFASERDFVYVIDKVTGEVSSRMPLDRKAQYAELKDGCLYVVDAAENVYKYQIEAEPKK